MKNNIAVIFTSLVLAACLGACARGTEGLSGASSDDGARGTSTDGGPGAPRPEGLPTPGNLPGQVEYGTQVENPEEEAPPHDELEGLRLNLDGCSLISSAAMRVEKLPSRTPDVEESYLLIAQENGATVFVAYFFPPATIEERELEPMDRLDRWLERQELDLPDVVPSRVAMRSQREGDEMTLAAALNAPRYLLLRGDPGLIRAISIIDRTQRMRAMPESTQPRSIDKREPRRIEEAPPNVDEISIIQGLWNALRGKTSQKTYQMKEPDED